MAHDVPREQQVGPLLVGRLRLGRDLHQLARLRRAVGVLDEQAAANPLDVGLDLVLAALGVLEDPDRLLLLEHLERAVLVGRRDQHLDELLVQALGERLS